MKPRRQGFGGGLRLLHRVTVRVGAREQGDYRLADAGAYVEFAEERWFCKCNPVPFDHFFPEDQPGHELGSNEPFIFASISTSARRHQPAPLLHPRNEGVEAADAEYASTAHVQLKVYGAGGTS